MTDAKKFLLLDPSNISKLAELFPNANQRLQPLRAREIHELDRNMLNIINDQSLTDREKVAEYNSTLTEFQTMSKEKTISSNQKPTKELKGINISSNTVSPQHELIGIPKTYHNKAKNLLELLKSTHDVQISENGEVTIGRETIRGSNIADLLNKTVNPNAKIQSLAGWSRFQTVLKEGNIPQTLLNQKVKREIRLIPEPKKKTKQFKVKSPKKSVVQSRWEPY